MSDIIRLILDQYSMSRLDQDRTIPKLEVSHYICKCIRAQKPQKNQSQSNYTDDQLLRTSSGYRGRSSAWIRLMGHEDCRCAFRQPVMKRAELPD